MGANFASAGSGYDDSTANLYITYPTVNQYFDIILRNYEQFVENLYSLGARSIGVTSLPPLGCLPGMITLFGFGKDECVDRLNYDALSFNRRLNSTSQALKQRLDDLNLVVLDLYQPLYSIILINPIQNGTVFGDKKGVLWNRFI
ncbi:hypothetical protein F8388_025635 [Cannabis sativa]|uniref:GDSL esterase/lipase n=1 Tax=Cannabis sativa TaxID=3483 RepID=A0A7J6G191_CANSA|nr:hypothetical protein F8388_025635 [Cannabis sativa]